MTPGTRLLEAARAWRDLIAYHLKRSTPGFCILGEDRALFGAVEALSNARALYPTPHALGDRVSVVYPPEKHPEYEDFTGTVTGVEFHTDGIDYRVTGDGDPDYTVVDSAFVHPAPQEPGCITGARIGAEAGAASPSWFPMDGRRVTEGSPGEAPYKPVTDKARRESIARAVIRSKPGPEGGDCDIDYRAAALVLFNLLDDIDTLDDACREDDAAFRRLAMVKARRREDVGASFDGYTVAFIGERAYAEGEKRTSEPSCAEGSPTSSIADVPKTTFDPAVHGNTFGCLRLGGHIFDRCQRAADHEGPCVPASKPCPDCGTPPSRPHQPGCPTAAKQW